MNSDAALAEIREALQSDDARIRLVRTFSHGRGIQVYVKTRKVGPLLLPSDGEDLSHLLSMVGSLAIEGQQ